MGDNILRLESVEFEDWGASRISGKFDVDQRTFIYGADSVALNEILKTLRRGLGLVEEARDGVYPRLESVEFEGWSASRIDGKFDVDQRTFIYGADSDALYEIVDAIRRGLGIVEEALDGVYPRLESVEFEDRARVGLAASSTSTRERSFTTLLGTRFAKLSTRFVAGSESSKKHWTAIIRGWKASSSRGGARVGLAASSTSPRERSFTTSPGTLFAKLSTRFVAGSESSKKRWTASIRVWQASSSRTGARVGFATSSTSTRERFRDALREILRLLRRGLGIVEETRDGIYPRLASVEFEDWGANRIGGNFDGAPRTLLYDVAPDAFREILRAIRRGLEIVEETLERRRRI
ncbi:MAG: hypothetical protein J6K25_00470 [Thermoguttaceae bacterium]|nr:hypothetical protein [Thermoguttaceae bacterium]